MRVNIILRIKIDKIQSFLRIGWLLLLSIIRLDFNPYLVFGNIPKRYSFRNELVDQYFVINEC